MKSMVSVPKCFNTIYICTTRMNIFVWRLHKVLSQSEINQLAHTLSSMDLSWAFSFRLTRQNANGICIDHVIYTHSQDGLHIFCGRVRMKFAFNQLNLCLCGTSGNCVKWKVAGNENKIILNWMVMSTKHAHCSSKSFCSTCDCGHRGRCLSTFIVANIAFVYYGRKHGKKVVTKSWIPVRPDRVHI